MNNRLSVSLKMAGCKPCLVQIKFYSHDRLDAKKVRVCGLLYPIESNSAGYIRDVFYPLNPTEYVATINRNDLELAKTLDKFDCVVVQTEREALFLRFLSYYIQRSIPIVVLQPALDSVKNVRQNEYERVMVQKRVESRPFQVKQMLKTDTPSPYLLAVAQQQGQK